MDQNLFKRLQGVDIGSKSDDFFRGLGFSRGRQDAIDFMHRMREQDPAHQLQKQQEQRQAFNQQLRGEEEEFLGRFRTEFPTILSGIEEELQLPQLRERAFETGEQVRSIPGQLEQSTQGTGMTADQLEAKIAGRQQEALPLAQEAVRQAQFAEGEFGRRAQQEMVPFETEINFMKDRFARESSGFSEDAESRLNLLLEQIRQEGAQDLAKIQEATKLAQMEQDNENFKNSVQEISLGDRKILIDPFGNQVGSFDMGIPPKSGGAGGNIGTIEEQQNKIRAET